MPTTFEEYQARSHEHWNHAREIRQPYGEIDTILEWCKRELSEDWRWQLVDTSSPSQPGRYIFYFNGDKDYFAFTLKWG